MLRKSLRILSPKHFQPNLTGKVSAPNNCLVIRLNLKTTYQSQHYYSRDNFKDPSVFEVNKRSEKNLQTYANTWNGKDQQIYQDFKFEEYIEIIEALKQFHKKGTFVGKDVIAHSLTEFFSNSKCLDRFLLNPSNWLILHENIPTASLSSMSAEHLQLYIGFMVMHAIEYKQTNDAGTCEFCKDLANSYNSFFMSRYHGFESN